MVKHRNKGPCGILDGVLYDKVVVATSSCRLLSQRTCKDVAVISYPFLFTHICKKTICVLNFWCQNLFVYDFIKSITNINNKTRSLSILTRCKE